MMRIAIVTVLAAVVAGGAVAVVSRAADNPGRTIVVIAHPRGVKTAFAHPTRPSLGDRVVERGVLTNPAGRPYGTFGMQGTLLSLAGRGGELGLSALALPAGTITAAGLHVTQETFMLPVVGGTGAYVGARGTAFFSPAGHEAVRVRLVLKP